MTITPSRLLQLFFGDDNWPVTELTPEKIAGLIVEVESVLDSLTDRRHNMMQVFFGLSALKPHTVEETANMYRVTVHRVREIEAEALGILRQPSRVKRITEFLTRPEIMNQNQPAPVLSPLATIRIVLDALKKHRNNIYGPDYDYEKDATYQPEAELYRMIPLLERTLSS